ncbi:MULTISPECIES: lantibiotic dehydratase [unclassified Streptomyces]|uniref:lantibiotic dehydratase n=1 Tax=unclassified Streptomyces TaxID=2593676 RepID=UPI002DD7D1C9|nr:lantibiotic dehydratase [Streptomyces sp. NBC_01775]WSB74819.1 lantibiotic dehydratase [Streptomyces sp. NBC_01775]WSS45641.1 lantibiotic dehydratase [Streptomyces sp. NBC_01187]
MSAFAALDTALFRMATVAARDDLENLYSAWRGRDINEAADTDIAEYISDIADDPVLAEGIALSSEGLSSALSRIRRGDLPSRKRLLRMAHSVTKYALRISGRPTPFGIFAGVARARVGEGAHAKFGTGHQKRVRPDAGWLTGAAEELFLSGGNLSGFAVALNDLCAEHGNELLCPWARTTEGTKGKVNQVSIVRNDAVDRVCALTRTPREVSEVVRAVARSTEPPAPPSAVEGLVRTLIRNGFLITTMVPRNMGGQALRTVLAGSAGDAALRAGSALSEYAAAPVGQGLSQLTALSGLMQEVHRYPRQAVQADLLLDADVQVPQAVGTCLEEFADAMWRMGPQESGARHMEGYTHEFTERYGIQVPVPVVELVDPVRGLGYPAAYGDGRPPERAPSDSGREALLSELYVQTVRSGSREVSVTEDLVARFESLREAPASAPPASLELCVQILSRSTEDLDLGDFELLLSRFTGSRTAGATAGRFADALGIADDLHQMMGAHRDDGPLYVQLDFDPSYPGALNVAQVPRLLPRQMPIGVLADAGGSAHLDWRSLAVTSDGKTLRLIHGESGREVVPVAPHVLNLERIAPDIVRFLVDVSAGGFPAWSTWSWGSLESMPYLPRVRYGKLIVKPARWKPSETLLDPKLTWQTWRGELRRWQAEWDVPRRIDISLGDEYCSLDLDNSLHQAVLRRELQGRGVRISESLAADPSVYGWTDLHAHEVVVGLARRATIQRPAPALISGAPAAASAHQEALPGGEWVHAKIYAPEWAHDELIADVLPGLVAEVADSVDRWFFIRYRDPDPHLRLRLHGPQEELRGPVLGALHDAMRHLRRQGLIRDFVLAGYVPEVHRYGGAELMPLAEEVFAQDSWSAICQIRSRRRGGTDCSEELLAAAHHGVLLEALGSWPWWEWVAQSYAKNEKTRSFYRENSAEALRLIRPGNVLGSLLDSGEVPGMRSVWTEGDAAHRYGSALLGSAEQRTVDIAVRGLLHMQHNRLLGIKPDREERGYGILRGIARQHLGELTHRRSG